MRLRQYRPVLKYGLAKTVFPLPPFLPLSLSLSLSLSPPRKQITSESVVISFCTNGHHTAAGRERRAGNNIKGTRKSSYPWRSRSLVEITSVKARRKATVTAPDGRSHNFLLICFSMSELCVIASFVPSREQLRRKQHNVGRFSGRIDRASFKDVELRKAM